MTSKAAALINYLKDTKEAEALKKKIKSLDSDIQYTEYLFEHDTECIFNRPGQAREAEVILGEELHNMRLRRLGLKVKLNAVERRIIQFELAQELAD